MYDICHSFKQSQCLLVMSNSIQLQPGPSRTASDSVPSPTVPMTTLLPGRKRTSTVHLHSRGDQEAVLKRLQELEAKTDKRLKVLEQQTVLTRRLMSTVAALNEEHQSFDRQKSDMAAQLHGQREHFQTLLQQMLAVVERAAAEGREGTQLLQAHVEVCASFFSCFIATMIIFILMHFILFLSSYTGMWLHVQDIRFDLSCLVQETMREARPEENGVMFKSMLSTSAVEQSSVITIATPTAATAAVSMTSKGGDLPGSDDIKTLVEGLKRLDAAFQQKVGIVESLAAGQQSLAQNVVEVEQSVSQLKYLTLHSIQLPAKPTPTPK